MFSVVATAAAIGEVMKPWIRSGWGAGIDGGDRHHRLLDLGILADRQVEDALEAEEQDEGGEDGREDRPADEELGEMHRRP